MVFIYRKQNYRYITFTYNNNNILRNVLCTHELGYTNGGIREFGVCRDIIQLV